MLLEALEQTTAVLLAKRMNMEAAATLEQAVHLSIQQYGWVCYRTVVAPLRAQSSSSPEKTQKLRLRVAGTVRWPALGSHSTP